MHETIKNLEGESMHGSYVHLYLMLQTHIKTSGSELWPRKVELASAHKKRDGITTKPVKTPTKQPYCIDIFIS